MIKDINELLKRGMVQITDKGKKSLSQNLDLNDIENTNGFLNFYNDEKTKGITENTENKNLKP
jgi:restriction system protein